jgi:hypothetical protein
MGFLGLATTKELEELRKAIEELSNTGVIVSDLTDGSKVFMGDEEVASNRASVWMFIIGRRYHFGLNAVNLEGYTGRLFIAPPPVHISLGGLVGVGGVRTNIILEENVGSGAEETPAQAFWTTMPVGRPGIGFYVPNLGLDKVSGGDAGVVNGKNIPWNLKYGIRTFGTIDQIP